MATGGIKERLTHLEAEVARLRGKIDVSEQCGKPWWEQIAGTFVNDPIYDEAMQLGRKYRKSLRPKQSKRSARRHADT
jgi:hypothetical protein